MVQNIQFTSKRAWVKANPGAMVEIAEQAGCTRQWVYQVLYYGIPTRTGKVERLLRERGAPGVEIRERGAA